MPVEAQHAAQGLEPERIREPPQDLVRAELTDNVTGDFAREPDHAGEQPCGRFAGMQRKMRQSGSHEMTVSRDAARMPEEIAPRALRHCPHGADKEETVRVM